MRVAERVVTPAEIQQLPALTNVLSGRRTQDPHRLFQASQDGFGDV